MANIKFSGGTGNTNPTTGQQYVLTKEGLQGLAAATITKITGPDAVSGGKSITIYYGTGNSETLGVGSAISLPDNNNNQNVGTVRLKIDGTNLDVPVFGLGQLGSDNTLTLSTENHLMPTANGEKDLGGANHRWNNMFANNVGTANNPTPNGYFTNLYLQTGSDPNTYAQLASTMLPTAISDAGHFWRGDGTWSNELAGPLSITNTTNGVTPDNTTATSYTANTAASIHTNGGIYAAKDIWARRVFNAVFNDYAEYRTTINLEPGRVVVDQDDGSLACASARLQPGAQVISDTFGHSMGETDTAKTPLAVAGRVLVYPYQARENYHAGMAVCSAPDGTVDIMTREEIRDYPDCIVGIVSEIPQYETWGSDNVKVDGRIWVRIK